MSEKIRAICAALEYIEAQLKEPITVADIAAAAGYSLYHFIRTFNQTVQHTPYDYLMRRRLSEAAGELLSKKCRVIDIALDFQFNSHETFTRGFGRIFGMPPTQWREAGFSDYRFLMPALGQDYLEYLNAPEFKRPKLVGLDEMILAGLMTPVTADPEVIPYLWRNLRGALRGRPEKPGLPLNPGGPEYPGRRDFWGIHIPPPMPEGSSFYFAGVKISTVASAPSIFVTKIIPAGEFICLRQNNMAADLDAALTYLYHTFLPKSDLQLANPLEIEHFGEVREILIPIQVSPSHPENT